MKKSRSNFPFIEACLYGYKGNRARLMALQEELDRIQHSTSVNAQQYDALPASSTGEYGDPVFKRAAYIDKLEHDIADLERCVRPIDRLCNDMEECTRDNPMSAYIPLKLMMEKRYFGKCTKNGLDMSDKTYRRVRERLVIMAGMYMGL